MTAWDNQLAIDGLRIPGYSCPSDPLAKKQRDPGSGRSRLYPTNYGFNYGSWFVFDPETGNGGDGTFFPNSGLSLGDCIDGTSQTLLAAEVKAWTPYMRNGGPGNADIPQTVGDVQAAAATGVQFKNTGHTEWPDGRVHHSGITTTLTPNTKVPFVYDGTEYDVDYNSWQEGKDGINGSPTYASITTRSFHTGVIQAALMDGSVQAIANEIDLEVWRALGTRAGREVISSDDLNF